VNCLKTLFQKIFKREEQPRPGISLDEIRRLQAGCRPSWLSRPALWWDKPTEPAYKFGPRISEAIRKTEEE
jgi:hypothetical protein